MSVDAVPASADFEIGVGKAREIAIRKARCPEFGFRTRDKCARERGRREMMTDDVNENETLDR